MFKSTLLFLIGVLACTEAFGTPGFQQFVLNAQDSRPLKVAVWYPSDGKGESESAGENRVFRGVSVLPAAKPAAGLHPLLLLSHGYGGNWRNLGWLAGAMAAQGYIVIASNHPGTTTEDLGPVSAQQLWRRPGDLIRAMDHIITHPAVAGQVDPNRIAAVGHSLGGWTVMMLAGARFDPQRFQEDCHKNDFLSSCRLMGKLGIALPSSQAPLVENRRDSRIRAVVSLDAGLTRGFTRASLAAIDVPVLVLAAQSDSHELPTKMESGLMAQSLPAQRVTYQPVEHATHFSFMQLCKPEGEALIEKSAPGEGIVCRDGDGVSREKIHADLLSQISRFLNTALDFQQPASETSSATFR